MSWDKAADMWIEREARKIYPCDYIEESSIKPTKQELAWLKQLQKVVDSQPPNTWVYLSCSGGGGLINLMRLGPDGEQVMLPEHGIDNLGGADPNYIIDSIRTKNWDGGDW